MGEIWMFLAAVGFLALIVRVLQGDGFSGNFTIRLGGGGNDKPPPRRKRRREIHGEGRQPQLLEAGEEDEED
jgi:hypothetical protein